MEKKRRCKEGNATREKFFFLKEPEEKEKGQEKGRRQKGRRREFRMLPRIREGRERWPKRGRGTGLDKGGKSKEKETGKAKDAEGKKHS